MILSDHFLHLLHIPCKLPTNLPYPMFIDFHFLLFDFLLYHLVLLDDGFHFLEITQHELISSKSIFKLHQLHLLRMCLLQLLLNYVLNIDFIAIFNKTFHVLELLWYWVVLVEVVFNVESDLFYCFVLFVLESLQQKLEFMVI